MDDETMFMIHGEDYLRHINDKVGMYLLVKELTKSVSDLPDCPANHGTRHFSKIVDAVAENAFKNWDIPESYGHETQQSNDTSAQPQLHAMGAARSDPRRGVIPMRQEQPAA